MNRLTVLCFAGTYALALACDLARPAVRGAARWYATVGLTALGLIVQTVYLANRAIGQGGLPAATAFDTLLALAWVLAIIDVVLLIRAPRTSAVGLFILPIVLALAAAAGWRAPREDGTGGAQHWATAWLWTHIGMLLAGAVGMCVAFVAGLMYLAQSRRLKHKRPTRLGFALPSLEQSDRWNRRAITWAFPLLTAGVLIGVALIATQRPGERVLGWSDPKVFSTLALWALSGALLYARYRPEWHGRRVMILTVVAFAALAFAMVGVGLVLPTAHGGRPVVAGRAP